jgi:predicted DNA binding CopG/RHH family protein
MREYEAMSKPAIRYESTQEPLDDEERELMNPDNWDWESAYEIEPSPNPGLIFEVRLAGDDFKHVERAATAEGMTITAYLRYAALHRALQHTAN